MKKLLLALCLSTAFAIPTYAATEITNATISLTESESDPGYLYGVDIKPATDGFEITDIEWARDEEDRLPGRSNSIELTVEPLSGYYFKNTKFSADGPFKVTSTRGTSQYEKTVKISYTPKMRLVEPESAYFDGDTAVWDEVPFADQYEIKIYRNGSRKATKKVSDPHFNIRQYISGDKDAEYTFSVRARSSSRSKYIFESEWIDSEDYITGYAESSASKYQNQSSGSSSHNNIGPVVGANAPLVPGWNNVSGRWFYYENNQLVKNAWKTINGSTYCFGSDGAMFVGWQTNANGQWYYFNPAKTADEGKMCKGWIQDGSHWYYLDASGIMQTGWYKDAAGVWYYLNRSASEGTVGAMATGYRSITADDGRVGHYYFGENPNHRYGAMYVNEQVPDGRYAGDIGAILP